jgi:hypothetical protein
MNSFSRCSYVSEWVCICSFNNKSEANSFLQCAHLLEWVCIRSFSTQTIANGFWQWPQIFGYDFPCEFAYVASIINQIRAVFYKFSRRTNKHPQRTPPFYVFYSKRLSSRQFGGQFLNSNLRGKHRLRKSVVKFNHHCPATNDGPAPQEIYIVLKSFFTASYVFQKLNKNSPILQTFSKSFKTNQFLIFDAVFTL